MNFEQFVSAMAAGIKEYTTREEYVEKQEILRNNGVVSVGIVIRTKKQKAAPLIYLEEYYQKYQEGAPLETLVQHLLDRSRHAPAPPVWDYEEILNFEKIKSRIVYKMINAKQNEKLLEKVPNLPILDFAIVFYLLISADDEGECSVLIRNEHMNLWEVPISVLYQMAKNNTPKLCPYRIKSICECIEIPEEEAYAANCIWVNDTVIVPEGYPAVESAVKSLGYKVLLVDTSEYRKVDGGLSCLSLRF